MSEPFEVRSAKQFLSAPKERPEPSGETIPIGAEITSAVDRLLNEMVEADEVHIAGLIPWECSQRLIQLQHERNEKTPSPPAKTVHYFIPPRDDPHIGTLLGTRMQRWMAGLSGVRNWVVPGRAEETNRDTLHVYEYHTDPTLGCLVGVRSAGSYHAVTLQQLPTSGRTPGPLITAPCDGMAADIARRHFVEDLVPHSEPVLVRQVRCMPPEQTTAKNVPEIPRINRFTERRRLERGETEPAAVVAVCARRVHGKVVWLKRRTPANALDDFNKLSLVSERVLVTDLPEVKGRSLSKDDHEAMEQAWRWADEPEPYRLTEEAFRSAARRELFISCGLDIDPERLRHCGNRLVEREEDGTHLGFVVYRLDLIGDEDDQVKAWSEHMVAVPVKELYGNRYRKDLNRLLLAERQWLSGTVLADERTRRS